jgi:enoyl-CoA hydratase/carnithine racemase
MGGSVAPLPDEIQVRADGRVRIVTLNRPEQMNATNEALHRGLAQVWRQLAADPDACAVVLTGAGRAFSAGGDFHFMTRLQQEEPFRERVMEEARTILLDMIHFPLPLIAAVNGPAVGLGCSLALSCDIVLISERAHLADPHVSIGLVAGDGGAALWPLFTSLLRAKEYLFTGDAIEPALAVQIGLANRVVPADALHEEALRLAQRLAALPQRALRDTKRALTQHVEKAVAGPLEVAIQAELASLASPEHAALVSALLARSKRR